MHFFITIQWVIGLLSLNILINATKLHSQMHDYNPMRIHAPAQRRQGYGYSSSIIHYTPGESSQHAQSEISVNMNLNDVIRQPKITNNDVQSLKTYHQAPPPSTATKTSKSQNFDSSKQLFQSQLPNQMQIQPQKGMLRYNIKEPKPQPKSTQQVSTSNGQNSFNVGYSIGFGTPETTNRNQGASGFLEMQKFTPEIVTGTPNDKVLKPLTFQSDIQPKDYVINAMESFQKQGFQMAFPKPTPKKVEENNFKYQQFGGILTDTSNLNYNPKTSKKLSAKVKNNVETDTASSSFGWKSLSPTLEVASTGSSNSNLNSRTPLTVTSKHTNGHALVGVPQPQQFNHAEALGHSQGFDYSNAMNLENNLTPQLQQPSPTTFHQTPIDKTVLENFYKQYQPVSLNWFNNQDAITTATTQQTPESSNVHVKTNQYVPNPLPIDTRLLQAVPYLTSGPIQQQPSGNNLPIHFDTSLLQKALLANGNNGQIRIGLMPNENPSQPNSVYALPSQQAPKTELSSYNDVEISHQTNDNHKLIRQDNKQRHYYHNHAHDQRNNAAPQQINHRIFQNQQAATSSDQHGSHSTQVNSIMPMEQVIKGKHKKPGVVRHPRILNTENIENINDMTTAVVSNTKQINARNSNLNSNGQQFNLNTALRPPPINYIIKKKISS